jgi:CheY-like chemotaxis protein
MTASRSELRRILVVDDDPDVRSVISLSLGRVGKMEVVEAHSGHDAIERLRRGTFDAIVLDVMMPGLDGPSTLERIRSEFGDSTTPVIFITAKVQPAEVRRLIATGAAAVIAKPFDPMTLPDEVRTIIERAA